MKYKLLILELFCLFSIGRIYGQWPVIYGDTINKIALRVWEHYDKGYIFTGQMYEGWSYYGWLNKTDINGEVRWSKSYGKASKMNQFTSSRITSDGGLIFSGSTNNLSIDCTDPLVIKINACGEKEWCKIYNAQGCNSWVKDIEISPGQGYIALIDRWKTGEEKRIWLFRLDSTGEVIWAQVYATDTLFWSELSHSLLMTTDTCFVITGQAYYPDPTYPNKWIIKIILIQVNLNGEAIFEVPWGTTNGIYSDGRLSIIDLENNIYTAGRRARTAAPYGDSPCLFKTSVTGEPVFYKDLKTTSTAGIATTINWFSDSTLVQCAGWLSPSGNDTTALIKTDSLGNFIKEKPLLINYSSGSFWGSDITYNDRLILAGFVYSAGVFNAYAFKVTSELEYDSVYTTPFTYDSLCPYPIVSDTIPMDDCEVVIVGIDEALQDPETTKLHVYPNPAKNRITIELPKYLVRRTNGLVGAGSEPAPTSGFGITATTIYHQWKEVRLEVFDLFGRLMYSEMIPRQEKSIKLDISTWPGGMYVARMVFMNEVVGSAKFIVEKP
ncbi:MAG: T9SS type A sorting domain-containing protein [Bacteroidota bacterium]